MFNLYSIPQNYSECKIFQGVLVESLSDVEVVLGQLRDSMDGAVYRGEERIYYHEHHRTIRILNELMYYLMKELKPACDKSYEIFDAVKGEQAD